MGDRGKRKSRWEQKVEIFEEGRSREIRWIFFQSDMRDNCTIFGRFLSISAAAANGFFFLSTIEKPGPFVPIIIISTVTVSIS